MAAFFSSRSKDCLMIEESICKSKDEVVVNVKNVVEIVVKMLNGVFDKIFVLLKMSFGK